MSSDRVPCRATVQGWSPQQLAEYLRRMNLSGCDKVVLKNSISGSRFVNMSDSDLQKFPKLHAPLITKLSTEISKKEEKRGLFNKRVTPKYHEADAVPDGHGWAEDEFDDDEEFDDDYESPFSGDEGSGGDYESPNDEDATDDYEPPPSDPPEDHGLKLGPPRPLADGEYIDNRDRGAPPVLLPRPTVHRDPSPHCRDGRMAAAGAPGPPQIRRDKKPGKDSGSTSSPIRGASPQRSSDKPAAWRAQPDVLDPPTRPKLPTPHHTSSPRPGPSRFEPRSEPPPDEAKHNTFPLHNKRMPPRGGPLGPPSRHGDSVSSAASLPHKLHSALAEQRGSFVGSDRQSLRPPAAAAHGQDLDSSWYVGKVTRGQAEECLRHVSKDGAYLVRDSTRQQSNQPFTLMVFYQNKVYNVQIKQQNNNFLLGTGLKVQECFSSVSDIILHYSQSPLLLIDAKNRDSGQQNQCLLAHPAAALLGDQAWA